MPANSFNLGSDVVIDVHDPLLGGIQRWSHVTGFSARAQNQQITSRPLNGRRLDYHKPDGWEGTITLDRSSPAVDIYFANKEAAYHAGVVIPSCTITETITEVGGGITQWRYLEVSLTYDNAGDKRADDRIEQSVTFYAARRIQVV